MKLEIQVLFWDRHKNVAGLNRLMGSQSSPFVDNWISNGNEYAKRLEAQWAEPVSLTFHSVLR
jgi:hypothetical protein